MQSIPHLKRRFFFFVLLVAGLFSFIAAAQDKIPEKNPLGFRSDFGLELTIGGHVCASGGGSGSQIECKGNNVGWDMGMGLAIGGQVRPVKFFSLGLELSYMGLRPADSSYSERLFKRFFDLSIGPVILFHIPIRIQVMLLDISIGIKAAFVNGFLYDKPDGEVQSDIGDTSKYYRHRLFGPEISGVIGVDLFVVPRFGFGIELRPMATIYQTVCFDTGSDEICRGVDDDISESSRFGTPFKLFFGLHTIYYL